MHTFQRVNLSRDRAKALPPPPMGQTVGHGILNSTSMSNKFELNGRARRNGANRVGKNNSTYQFQNSTNLNKMY